MSMDAEHFDVAIAGAGPAGSSAAIRLQQSGARVLLVEEKAFPREKLCGEFISPECVSHFEALGVIGEIYQAGATAISNTVFYTRRGKSVTFSNDWFRSATPALGLSRREMDNKLLERAGDVGVTVIQNAHASPLVDEARRVKGLEIRSDGVNRKYPAWLTIDATGRTRALVRQLEAPGNNETRRRRLVAFKAHLRGATVAAGACEIYLYPRGYGGLSRIENGLSNLCFIVAAEDVRRCNSDPEGVMRSIVMKNARAAATLKDATVHGSWLSVSLDGFGSRKPASASGLLTIGDAASFIDPFTGSGMLMALESGELAAGVIARNIANLRGGSSVANLSAQFHVEYESRFASRLRVSGLLRRAAFMPGLAEATAFVCGTSLHIRRRLARSTRSAREVAASAAENSK